VVIDGVEGRIFDKIDRYGQPVFSANGAHVAYIGCQGDARCMVVDGREQALYRSVSTPHFSPDGEHLVYVADKDGSKFVVLDGREGGEYDAIATSPILSPDGKRTAYIADNGAGWCTVVDGREGPVYDEIRKESLQFSPDSRRVIYVAKKSSGRSVVVVEGTEGPEYPSIGMPVFSRDGQRLAYVVDVAAPDAGGKRAQAIVLDGTEGAHYTIGGAGMFGGDHNGEDIITSVTFSPDGRRVAFVVTVLREYRLARQLIVDGTEVATCHRIGGLAFSPDGQHLAYVMQVENPSEPYATVVVDGKEGIHHRSREETIIRWPFFSPDSKHVAYAIGQGLADERDERVILDGQKGPFFDAIYQCPDGTGPVFLGDGALEYLAWKDNAFYRIRHIPGSQ